MGYFGEYGNKKPASETTSITSAWEDSLPVSELYDADFNEMFLFCGGQAKPKQCQKLLYDEDSPFKERAASNPMHPLKKLIR
jgi:hypothetical protein